MLNYFEAFLSCGKLCRARKYVLRFSPELLFEGRKKAQKVDHNSVYISFIDCYVFGICEERRSGN
jgi:hypothetical protein